MYRPIPMDHVIDVALSYAVKRMIQGRPTTLRQMSRRVALGVHSLKVELEKNHVQYILIPHGDKGWVSSTVEIAIKTMPEKLAERNGFTLEQVEQAYDKYFGHYKMEPLDSFDPAILPTEEVIQALDPYSPYRIDGTRYRILKPQLISHPDLLYEARKRGYSGRAIDRATGGNRMRYALPSEVWRPYVYHNRRYYLREVLNYLHQAYDTYLRESTAALKKETRALEVNESGMSKKPIRRSKTYRGKKVKDDSSKRGAVARTTKVDSDYGRSKRYSATEARLLDGQALHSVGEEREPGGVLPGGVEE